MAKIGTIIPLPAETRANLGYDFIVRLTYLDLLQLTSATAQGVIPQNDLAGTTYTNPAGVVVEKVVPNVVTAFTSSGGAITSLTGSLGDGVSGTRFVNAQDLKTQGWGTAYTSKYCYAAADAIDFTPTISGQTMASLNAGQVDYYVKLADLSGLPSVVQPG